MIIKIKKLNVLIFALSIVAISAAAGIVRSSAARNAAVVAKTPLPIVMYHQISKNISRTGAYCVSYSEIENDLKYLKDRGYTTINIAQLLNHVKNGAPLPEKPVMITVDDGYETVYSYLFPLLEKYDMCAVASVVGSYTDLYTEANDHSLSYSYMTWDEVAELANGSRIEIQNHSYNLHKMSNCGRKGAKKVSTESEQEYAEFLNADIGRMQTEIQKRTGKKPVAFAYPFGCYSKESTEILKSMGFEAALICEEKLNYIDTENTEWLYRLRRYNRPHGQSSASFFAKLSVE